MRISSIMIRNYRSLKDLTIDLDKYGVFIGTNGSGKSSVLYALDWFFNDNTHLAVTDIHGYDETNPSASSQTIEVIVTFTDLTAKDRERLKEYGRGESAIIRKTWNSETNKTKTVGNSKQGPGFVGVFSESAIATRRVKYKELRQTYSDLQELTGTFTIEEIQNSLTAWESNPRNDHLLVEINDSDAEHMFGWHGNNVLKKCVRFVLIPAGTSIAGEVGTASKGTTLTELIGAFVSAASDRAQSAWLVKHSLALKELYSDIKRSIESDTKVQANRINARLESLIPNASVSLTPSIPEVNPAVNPSISTAVTIDGITNDVSRQGHGVQRAVMISMFQAVVPDEDLTRKTHKAKDGEDEATTQFRLEDSLEGLPSIIVAIEEPEIYQHPIRARAFARTLTELSERSNVQVLLATHSPYFVQPEQFSTLHRFMCVSGETETTKATLASVASASGIEVDKVKKAITAHVPTEFSEGFFADRVVLVEGSTDKIVLEELSRKLDINFDKHGVAIIPVGSKTALPVTRAILSALNIPTYVIADGDFDTSLRKAYQNKTEEEIAKARAEAHESHKAATIKHVASLPNSSAVIAGALPYSFGDATVVTKDYTIWRDDIEEELSAWPSFVAALSVKKIYLVLRNHKDLLEYRNAVEAADISELPKVLKSSLNAILGGDSVATAPEPESLPADDQE